MVAKKKKSSKMRGTREHGRGRKKGRGAGLRGGKGHAGSMNHKFVHYLKYDPEHFAHRHGFKRPPEIVVDTRTLNLRELEMGLAGLVAGGFASEQAGAFQVDLAKAGYDKLLGTGSFGTKVTVTVGRASGSAVKKVKAAGGSINQTDAPPPPPPGGKGPPPGGKAPPSGGKPAPSGGKSAPPTPSAAPKEKKPKP